MIYPITIFGDPVLKREADDIEEGSIDIKKLTKDMFETMKQASGIGLAAPQIGKSIRIFIVDGNLVEEEGMENFKKVFINPEMVWEKGDKWNFEEGCLSIPNIREEVSRCAQIRINYLDEDFVEHEEEFDGIQARIIQHEYDHIEGILFIDHLTPFKRKILKGKLANIKKGKFDADYKTKLLSKR